MNCRPAPRIEFYSARDGYRCAVRVWDVNQPHARVVCLHGIVSHGGWYLSSCGHLASAGIEVHFLDRRGSGLNVQARGDVDAWKTWPDDVEHYLARLPGGLPTVLLGISWGGRLAVAVARRRRQPLAGLALICPGLFAKKAAGPSQQAALRLALAAGLENLRVKIPLQDPALFTESAAWQSYIVTDPFTLRKLTIRAALADVELARYVAAATEIEVPTLLVLAGRDRIINNPAVRRAVENMPAADKQIIEYADAAHTLEFEPDPSRFFDDLSGWVRRIAGCRGDEEKPEP